MSAFQRAGFYELLGNRSGRLEREGGFLLKALARAPVNRVADLACGLGLHALFLAEHGAEVFASDLSEEMIRHAGERRPHTKITYAVADMRQPQGGPYGLALCLGNSLSLLPNHEALRRFFAAVAAVLAPGGLLITQTLNYDAPAMKRPRIRVERESVEDGDIAAVKRFLPGHDGTLLSITYFAATTGAFMENTETVLLKHWSAETLLAEAREARLTPEPLLGGFDGTPFRENSPDILLSAQKTS
ncbi:MAG TPA: class I SAM-dependent methyltransferase [Candidatus Hydrogenedentes bacterium]|nr:class I SAM-dependent methyltransferase [Candidatus Hydrogenedentota bacterium]